MKRETLTAILFLLIAALLFYLFYRLIAPFSAPLCWAAVIAIIFFPLYERLRNRLRSPGVASALMSLLVLLIIIGPITYLFIALVNEAADAVNKVNDLYRSGELDAMLSFDVPWFDTLREKLAPYYDLSKVNMQQIARDSIDGVSGVILNQTSWMVANGTKAVFYFVLMIFTLYYFFKDGERLIRRAKRIVPLDPERVNETFHQLRDVVQATMYGSGIVALFQGLLGGVLFAVFGVPSPVFWGALMAFLSIIPFLGAFIVYVPAGLILILGGSYVKGILMIGIGTIIVSQIDNLLRPYLISGRTQMHPLMLFFSIMGGIALFGILGMVVGPMIAAGFDTLVKILDYRLNPAVKSPSVESDKA
jgi:predicted PurR-regulated permease PerM